MTSEEIQGGRMLVVDDEPRNRKLIEGYLQSEGYELASAGSGIEALDRVRDWNPDIVLLDVMMPGMTGYEVCRRIKSDPYSRLVQVMLVTALDGTSKKVEGLDCGADDYVTKPVRRDEFLAKVRALVRARRLVLELESAREELSRRNRELELKRMLAQSIVHDLKSPLSAVLGNLDLLSMRVDQGQQYLIDRSRQGASRMLKMILNLLDVEALDEGKMQLREEPVDAVGVARAAVEECASSAAIAQVSIELDAVDEAWVRADRSVLRRVLDNLLSNAFTHTPSGGTVEVTVLGRPEGVEISVEDSGPGIPEEHRDTIFDKYRQVDGSEPTGASNRGLGLTFCKMAIEAHGGTIWVEQAPGGGARFRTILPDAPAKRLEPPDAARAHGA